MNPDNILLLRSYGIQSRDTVKPSELIFLLARIDDMCEASIAQDEKIEQLERTIEQLAREIHVLQNTCEDIVRHINRRTRIT